MASLSEMLQYAKYKNQLERQRSGIPALEQMVKTATGKMAENRQRKDIANKAQILEEQTSEDLFPEAVTQGRMTPKTMQGLMGMADKYLKNKYRVEQREAGRDILGDITSGEPGTTYGLSSEGLPYGQVTIPKEEEESVSGRDLTNFQRKNQQAQQQIVNTLTEGAPLLLEDGVANTQEKIKSIASKYWSPEQYQQIKSVIERKYPSQEELKQMQKEKFLGIDFLNPDASIAEAYKKWQNKSKREFDSVEEAKKANLPTGTQIIINDREAIVE